MQVIAYLSWISFLRLLSLLSFLKVPFSILCLVRCCITICDGLPIQMVTKIVSLYRALLGWIYLQRTRIAKSVRTCLFAWLFSALVHDNL